MVAGSAAFLPTGMPMRRIVMRPQDYYDELADVEKTLDEVPLDSGSISPHDEDRS